MRELSRRPRTIRPVLRTSHAFTLDNSGVQIMGDTVGQQDLHFVSQLGRVSRQGVAHLNGYAHLFGAMRQQVGEVLTRVLPPGEEPSELAFVPERYEAACEDAGALV